MKIWGLLISLICVSPKSGISGEKIRITRDGIQTCYQGASSIQEVVDVLQQGKDLAPLDPTPIVPRESEDPDPNPHHWKIPDDYSFGPSYYIWRPMDAAKISAAQFPYGKVAYGSGVSILNQPHIQGTMYRPYVPKNRESWGLVQVTEKHLPASAFSSKSRYYPAFAFQKFSLWRYPDKPDEVYLADHADDSLHLLWKRFKSPDGWNDYWYNTITDQIWSPQYDSLNAFELDAKAGRLDVEFGSDGFRVPNLNDYFFNYEMSLQHVLPGYDDPGMWMAFGQLMGPVQFWVANPKNSDALGAFYADEDDIIHDHWEYRKNISSSTTRRARFVLDLDKQDSRLQSQLRERFGLRAMPKEQALSLMKRRHDPRAVIPMKK